MPLKPALALFGLLSIALAGCASSSITRVGDKAYPPLSPAEDVAVFSTADDVKRPFDTLGIISHVDLGKYQVLTLGNVVPILKDQARSIGANGLIIDESSPVTTQSLV